MGDNAELKSEVMYIMDHIIETAVKVRSNRRKTPHAISRVITKLLKDSPLDLLCTGSILYHRAAPGKLVELDVKTMRKFIQVLSKKLGLPRVYADAEFYQLLMVEWLRVSSREGMRRVDERLFHVLGEK